jgi:hypothetical protein
MYWKAISKIEETELFIKAGELSYKEKLITKGIKLIDACIIYTTIQNNCSLWTLDKKMGKFPDKKYLYNPSGAHL